MSKINLFQGILIAFLLFMSAISYAVADYSKPTLASYYTFSDKTYYVVEAFILFFWSALCMYFNKSVLSKLNYRYYQAWKIMASFFLLRLAWEVSAIIQGVNVNEKKAMQVLFIMNYIAISCIVFIPWLNRIFYKVWQRSK